ncbi:glycosyltransferase family 25 protein [Proteus alimentorum]|uniref:glycosyltransferase family 25 protein n=1 Tax=Proteus alimentorum TaxID=1973495 RepID=UPI0013EC2E55|nr:glycosyltransferase family 25 protein [Proteus alimentorum]
MKIYIVNLEKDVERKASIKAQLDDLNLNYEFISAVYGKNLSQEEISRLSPDFEKTSLTLPELGCALSHLNVYKKIIENNEDIALILEDDVKLNPNLSQYLDILSHRNLTNKPEIILLNKVNEYIDSFKQKLNDTYSLVNVIDSVGAYGYCINQIAAKNLLKFLQPIWIVSDEWKLIREKNISAIKAIVPPLITFTIHADNSTISNEVRADLTDFDRKKRKRSLKESIRLIFWRIFIRSWVRKVRP